MLDRLRLILERRLETLTGRSAPQRPEPAFDPESTERLRKQGNNFLAEEKLDEAEACFREALEHTADDAQSLVCLGYVLKEQGRLAEARITLKRAINPASTNDQAFEAHYLLGEISEQQGDLADAIKYFKSSLALKPDFTRACEGAVRLLEASGRKEQVRPFLEELILACPSNSRYRVVLAERFNDVLDFQGTAQHLIAAVDLGVKDASVYLMLGAVLCRLEREEEARPYLDSALAMDPSVLDMVLYHRGYYYTRNGDALAGVELLEQAVQAKPDCYPAHSLLLLNLSHSANELNRSYREAVTRFACALENSTEPLPEMPVGAVDLARKVLRIGFVASEFREHPLYHFLIGVLEHIDRSRFRLVAFSSNYADDAATEVLKPQFAEWHDVKDLDDAQVAELVRTQRIDVLIDLSGHTGDARLPIFARKPAPVQVAWLGYWASTGLKAMDYIIADPVCVPEDSEEWFSEKVFRLPTTRLCMTAPRMSPPTPILQPPCKTNGYITFGSFQQAAKINAQTLGVWARVMAAVPQSRLKIQNKAIDSTVTREKLCANMAAAGIDLSRVELAGAEAWADYLESHNQIDIMLDTFPYPGGTTTAFALWMGVPTVALAGNTMLSRQGAAMLGCVGLNDWVAKDETEYVAIAQNFANDTQRLAQLRDNLRSIAEQSPLFDTKTFASQLEGALLSMHQEKTAALTNSP